MNKVTSFINKYISFLPFVIIVAHVLILLVTKFTAWPEMLAWPYLVLKGFLPYKDIAIVHTPMLIVVLSIFNKIFGVGPIQLKIFSILLAIITDLTIYWVVKRLYSFKSAMISLIVYILLQVIFEGNGLWFDLALVPLVFLTYFYITEKRLLLAGALWSIAILTKQTAIWLVLPILLMIGLDKKRLWTFFEGIFIVFSIFVIFVFLFKIPVDFYNWAIKFGVFYLPNASGQILFPTIKQFINAAIPFIMILPLILKEGRKYILLVIWMCAALMGVYPRWELFHFQPALPFLALLFSIFVMGDNYAKKIKFSLITLSIIVLLLLFGRNIFRNFGKQDRFLEPQVIEVAKYVKNLSAKNIFVVNTWDSLYALTNKPLSFKPLIPQLEWYLKYPGVEDRVVNELKLYPADVIVMQKFDSAYEPKKIVDYINRFYSLDKILDGGYQVLIKNK